MRQMQRDLHQLLRAESATMRQRIADRVRPLDPSQLVERPEPGAWSVGDVLEHLCRTEDAYGDDLAAAVAGARADAGALGCAWKSSLIGGLIANSLQNGKPLKSPKVFRPGPTPRSGVVEAFLAQEIAFVMRMDHAASFDWRKVHVASPALPRFMPKLNLGDVFRVHVMHVARHAGQIERLATRFGV